jgi:hypothetical protein
MRKNRFNLILNMQAMTLNKNMIGKNKTFAPFLNEIKPKDLPTLLDSSV